MRVFCAEVLLFSDMDKFLGEKAGKLGEMLYMSIFLRTFAPNFVEKAHDKSYYGADKGVADFVCLL